ncbi:MAG: hypothetical protein OEY67_07100 [Gammaproteobacteria bacterium]|nr:hypothetical protein [Gammaproteobacteria bacterium]
MPTQDNFSKATMPLFTKYDFRGSEANIILERDQVQSSRLHEPTSRRLLTDPMTGEDIKKDSYTPFLKDGNLTIYFKSDESRDRYNALPFNHPYLHLPYPAAIDDDRGG